MPTLVICLTFERYISKAGIPESAHTKVKFRQRRLGLYCFFVSSDLHISFTTGVGTEQLELPHQILRFYCLQIIILLFLG